MPIALDPENEEIKALIEIAGEMSGKSILEVGCGDGRLTRKYADQADRVIAIDPNDEKIARANQSLPEDQRAKLTFLPLDLEDFAAQIPESGPDRGFDLILFSWSL